MQEIVISNDQFSGEYNLILKYIFMCQDQRDQISYEFIWNWMSQTCSIVEREQYNKWKYYEIVIFIYSLDLV